MLTLTAHGLSVHIEPSAQERILEVVSEHRARALRVSVQGGGCSGLTYLFGLDYEDQEDDLAFCDEAGKRWVVVDPISAAYVDGATLAFKDELWERRFILQNPNARHTCGCGSSFTLD